MKSLAFQNKNSNRWMLSEIDEARPYSSGSLDVVSSFILPQMPQMIDKGGNKLQL